MAKRIKMQKRLKRYQQKGRRFSRILTPFSMAVGEAESDGVQTLGQQAMEDMEEATAEDTEAGAS